MDFPSLIFVFKLSAGVWTIQQFYLTKQQAGDKIFNSMVQKVKKKN